MVFLENYKQATITNYKYLLCEASTLFYQEYR